MSNAIYKYEREENKRRRPIIAEDEAQLNKWRTQIERCEKKDQREEADALRRKCFELEQRRIRPVRLIADDMPILSWAQTKRFRMPNISCGDLEHNPSGN